MKLDTTTDHALSLLVLWFRWAQSQRWVAGYPPECPSTRGWMASRQYDSDNGAFETDARGQEAERVEWIVESMKEPHRTALYILARNRALGVNDWRSPRLPTNEHQRAEIVADAVQMLVERV